MKSMMCMDSESVSIRKAADERGMSGDNLVLIDQDGEGDSLVRLWLTPWGQRVIETNGDPIWEVDATWLVEQLGVSRRRAESWVQGTRRPAWPELVLQRIDALR